MALFLRALAEQDPTQMGFWTPPLPSERNTIFYYEYGFLATIIVTITKCISVILGLYLIISVHKREKARKALPHWDPRSKKPYLLPIYHGFLYVLLILFITELVLLNLWEFNTHWSYIAIGELLIQSLICEGFVHPLTGSSVSTRSVFSSMSSVVGFSLYGAVMGLFVALCAQFDQTYKYSFVLLAFYNFVPLFYHAYIIYPFSSSSNVTPKRLAIKAFSRWIFIYRLMWMTFNILTYISHISEFTSPLLYFFSIGFLALFELPFSFVIVAMVRVDTVYWHSGAQNFLRTYTQQVAYENKQFSQSGMSITTLDDDHKNRAFTIPNVSKYLISNAYIPDTDRIIQCVPSVEAELKKLVGSHVQQVKIQEEILSKQKKEQQKIEQRKREQQKYELEQLALYQAQVQQQLLKDGTLITNGDSSEDESGGHLVGSSESFGRGGSNLSSFGNIPSGRSFANNLPHLGTPGSLTSSLMKDNHFLPSQDELAKQRAKQKQEMMLNEGQKSSKKSKKDKKDKLPSSLLPKNSTLHGDTSDEYDHMSDLEDSSSSNASIGNSPHHSQKNDKTAPNSPQFKPLDETDEDLDFTLTDQSGLTKPVINLNNRRGKNNPRLFTTREEVAGAALLSNTDNNALHGSVDNVVDFLEQVNQNQFPKEEIEIHNNIMNQQALAANDLFYSAIHGPSSDTVPLNNNNNANTSGSGSLAIQIGYSAPTGTNNGQNVGKNGQNGQNYPLSYAKNNIEGSSRTKTAYYAQGGQEDVGDNSDDYEANVDGEDGNLFLRPKKGQKNQKSDKNGQSDGANENLFSSNTSQPEHLDSLAHLTSLNGGIDDSNPFSQPQQAEKMFQKNQNHQGGSKSANNTNTPSGYCAPNITFNPDNHDGILRNDPLSPAVAQYAALYDTDDYNGNNGSFSRKGSSLYPDQYSKSTTRCPTCSQCLVACFGPGVWDILTFGLYTLFDSYRYYERDDLEEEEENAAMMVPSLDEVLMRQNNNGASGSNIGNADGASISGDGNILGEKKGIDELSDFNSAIAHPQLSLLNDADAKTLDLLQHVIDSNSRSLIALNQLEIFSNKILGQGTFAFVFMGELSLRTAQQSIRKKLLFQNRTNKPRRFVGLFDVILHSIARQFNKAPQTIASSQTLFNRDGSTSGTNGNLTNTTSSSFLRTKAKGQNGSNSLLNGQDGSSSSLGEQEPEQFIHPTTPHINDEQDYGNLSSWSTRLLKAIFANKANNDTNNDRLDLDLTKYLLRAHDMYSTQAMWQLQFQSYNVLARTQVILSMVPSIPVSNREDHSCLELPSTPHSGLFERLLTTPSDNLNRTGFSPLQLHGLLSLCTLLYLQQTIFQLHKSRLKPKLYRFHPSQLMTAGLQCTNNTPIDKSSTGQFSSAQVYQLQHQANGPKAGSVGDHVKKMANFVLRVFDSYRQITPSEKMAYQQLYQKPTLYQLQDDTYQTVTTLEGTGVDFNTAILTPEELQRITEDPLFKAQNQQNMKNYENQQNWIKSQETSHNSSFHSNASRGDSVMLSYTSNNSSTNTNAPFNPTNATVSGNVMGYDGNNCGVEDLDGYFFINLQHEHTQRLISMFLQQHQQEGKFPVQQLFAQSSSVIAKIEHNRRKVSYLNRLGSAAPVSLSSNTANGGISGSAAFQKGNQNGKISMFKKLGASGQNNNGNNQIIASTSSHSVDENLFSSAAITAPLGNNRLSPSPSSSFTSSSPNQTGGFLNNGAYGPMNNTNNGRFFNQTVFNQTPSSNTYDNSSFIQSNSIPMGGNINVIGDGSNNGYGQDQFVPHSNGAMDGGNNFFFEHSFNTPSLLGSFTTPSQFGNESIVGTPRNEHGLPQLNHSASGNPQLSRSPSTASTSSRTPTPSFPASPSTSGSILSRKNKDSNGNNNQRVSLYDLEDDSIKQTTLQHHTRVVDTVAVKFFKKSLTFSPSQVIAIAKETNLHCKMQHPNIVYCYGILVAPPTLAVLTEICARGDLYGLIEGQGVLRKRFMHLAELTQTLLVAFQKITQPPPKDTTNNNQMGKNGLNGKENSFYSLPTVSSSAQFNQTIALGGLNNKISLLSTFPEEVEGLPTNNGQNKDNDNTKSDDNNTNSTDSSTPSSPRLSPQNSVLTPELLNSATGATQSINNNENNTNNTAQQPQLSGEAMRRNQVLASFSTKTLIKSLHFAHRRLALITTQLWNLRTRLIFAIDAATAVAYCHSKQLLHRDIKSLNFFVNDDNVVKLADFGISKILKERALDLDYEYKKLIYTHPALRRNNVTVPMITSLLNKPNFPNDSAPRLQLDHGADVWHVDFSSAGRHVVELQRAAKYVTQLSRQYFQDHSSLKSVQHGIPPWSNGDGYSGNGAGGGNSSPGGNNFNNLYRQNLQNDNNDIDLGKMIAHSLLQRVEAWHIDNITAPLPKLYQSTLLNEDGPQKDQSNINNGNDNQNNNNDDDEDDNLFTFKKKTTTTTTTASTTATTSTPSSRNDQASASVHTLPSGSSTPSTNGVAKQRQTPLSKFTALRSMSSLGSLFSSSNNLTSSLPPQRPAYTFSAPAIFMTNEQAAHGTINLNNVYEPPPTTITPQQLRKMAAAKAEMLNKTYGVGATPSTVLSGNGPPQAQSLLNGNNGNNGNTFLDNNNSFIGSPSSIPTSNTSSSTHNISSSTSLSNPNNQNDFFYDPLAELINVISLDGENPMFAITSLSPNNDVMMGIDATQASTRTYLSEFSEFGDFSFSFQPKITPYGGGSGGFTNNTTHQRDKNTKNKNTNNIIGNNLDDNDHYTQIPDEQEMARLDNTNDLMNKNNKGTNSKASTTTTANNNKNVTWSFFSQSNHHFSTKSSISKHTTNQGTSQWLAPEAFNCPSAEQVEPEPSDNNDEDDMSEPKSIIEYSYPVDVYALGLTLWEILCIQPMDSRDLDTTTLRFTRDIPFQLRLLLLSSIDQRPQLRPTAKQIVDVLTVHLYMLDFVATYINNSSFLKL